MKLPVPAGVRNPNRIRLPEWAAMVRASPFEVLGPLAWVIVMAIAIKLVVSGLVEFGVRVVNH